MKNRKTDVIVIGAGTAGLAAYRTVRDAGHRAIVVDHGPLGTTCARVGCMPSKAALHAGRRFATATASSRVDAATQAKMRDRLWRGVGALRDDLAGGTADTTCSDLGRDLVMGRARFVAPDTIEVDGRHLQADAFVIATGSHPVVPDALSRFGVSVATGILTTDTLFSVKRLPTSLGLLGLGAIGIELGLAMARLGVRVVAVEEKPFPAAIDDPVVARRAIDTLGSELQMHLGARGEVTRDGTHFRLAIGDATHRVERVLAALGRKPDLDDLALDQAGVTWDEGAKPPIDRHTLRLGRSTLFVAGDAHGERPLQHEALDEGRIAAGNALAIVEGRALKRPTRRTPLSIVFSDPDVAQVGMRYADFDREHMVIGTGSGDHNGRSKIVAAENNLLRVYAEKSTGRLLGASLMSVRGEHLAHLLALAIGRRLTASQLLDAPFYHPTIEEMLQTALKDVTKRLRA